MIIEFATLTFQGRLTSDPEIKTLSNGTVMCKFSVASNKRISKEKEKTAFIPVTVFGTEAVNCGKYLTKGRAVHITGDFETDKYEDRGKMRTGFGVVARHVKFGPGGTKNTESTEDGDTNLDVDLETLDANSRRKVVGYIRGLRGGRNS